MAKKRIVFNSYMQGNQLHIDIPRETKESELSFVLTRTLYFMVQKYSDDNHIEFDKALILYKEAIATDVGRQYDMERKNDKRG